MGNVKSIVEQAQNPECGEPELPTLETKTTDEEIVKNCLAEDETVQHHDCKAVRYECQYAVRDSRLDYSNDEDITEDHFVQENGVYIPKLKKPLCGNRTVGEKDHILVAFTYYKKKKTKEQKEKCLLTSMVVIKVSEHMKAGKHNWLAKLIRVQRDTRNARPNNRLNSMTFCDLSKDYKAPAETTGMSLRRLFALSERFHRVREFQASTEM